MAAHEQGLHPQFTTFKIWQFAGATPVEAVKHAIAEKKRRRASLWLKKRWRQPWQHKDEVNISFLDLQRLTFVIFTGATLAEAIEEALKEGSGWKSNDSPKYEYTHEQNCKIRNRFYPWINTVIAYDVTQFVFFSYRLWDVYAKISGIKKEAIKIAEGNSRSKYVS